MEEAKIPIEQRFLIIVGIVEGSIRKKIFKNRFINLDSTSICCFVSFSYADLPVGKTFEIVFRRQEPEKYVKSPLRITGVTQQFGDELNSIPYGWKTICIIDFPDGIPEIILDLPVVDNWYKSDVKEHLCVSNQETYEVIEKRI